MTRGPTLRVPNVDAPLKGSDTVDFARFLRELPILAGRLVDLEFATSNLEVVRHGLGRRYRGAIVVGASTGHDEDLTVITPQAASTAGYDPATYVVVSTQANYTGTVRLWVF